MHRLVTLSLAAVLITACATHDPEAQRFKILDYVERHDRPDFVRNALLDGRLAEGMDPRDVTMLHGRPVRVNTSSTGTEQAVYRQLCPTGRVVQEGIYVYFEGGKVTGWQHFGCY